MQISYISPKEKYSSTNFLKSQMKRELSKFKDEKTQIKLTSCVATIALANINTYANTMNIETFKIRVNSKGNQILSLVQIIGYWIAIVAAAIDIIKNFRKQDIAGLFAVAFKYAALFGILKGLPWFFQLIGDLFDMEG